MEQFAKVETIGFVGLGRMGYSMAGHLVSAGYTVMPFDTDAAAVARFCKQFGGSMPDSLAALGSNADVVITMLPSSPIVRKVILGESGVAAGMSKGEVIVDMSTSAPHDTQALGEALAPMGIHVVDAPVSGGMVFAKDATLDVLTGGPRDLVDHLAPLFDVLGSKTFYCGALGSAHAMKAINNFVNASVLTTYLEALVVGRRFGIDMQTLLPSMESATQGRNHPLQKKIYKQVLSREFASGMALELIAKDVQIAVDTAHGLGMVAPMAEATSAVWHEAVEKLGGQLDQTEIAKFWEQSAGIELVDR